MTRWKLCREGGHGLGADGDARTDTGGKSSDCRRAGREHGKLSFLV